jgi:hypothetical protein
MITQLRLRLLLGRGAAVDCAQPDSGWTAFHYACMNDHAESAEAMARAGCDVGLKDKSGQTGRELAEERGYAAAVERLRAAGGEQLRAAQAAGPVPAPEPAAVVGDGGPTAQLVKAATEGDGAAVARLLAAGADLNASVAARTAAGEVVQTTVVCEAAAHGRLEAVRLLLDGGADLSVAGSDGRTPLMQAAFNGHLEVLRLLLRRGAAVDAVNLGSSRTALHSACRHNQVECAEALARAGCDVGVKGRSGQTGRELAEVEGSKEAARPLTFSAWESLCSYLCGELYGELYAGLHNKLLSSGAAAAGPRAPAVCRGAGRAGRAGRRGGAQRQAGDGERASGRHAAIAPQCSCRARALCLHAARASKNAMCGSRMAVELTAPPPPLRHQVLRYLPQKRRYTLELLDPAAGGRGRGEARGRAAGELRAAAGA